MGVAHEESRQSRPAWDGGSLRGGIDVEPDGGPGGILVAAPKPAHPTSLSIRILFAVCAITLLVQAVLVLLDPQAVATSNVLIALEFLFATAGCLGSTSRQNAETRALWILVAFGFLLSIAGQILGHVRPGDEGPARRRHRWRITFFWCMAFQFFWRFLSLTTKPICECCSGWTERRGSLRPFSIYFQIFSILPWTGHTTSISATSLMYVYDVENLIFSGAVTLRLFGRQAPAKRRLYIAMSIYLWCYAVVALILDIWNWSGALRRDCRMCFGERLACCCWLHFCSCRTKWPPATRSTKFQTARLP